MPLQLQVVSLPKHPLVPANGLPGSVEIALHDLLRHLATQTGRSNNQSLVVLLQQLLIDTRPVKKALHRSNGSQLKQIAVTRTVLRQQNQVATAAVEVLIAFKIGRAHV